LHIRRRARRVFSTGRNRRHWQLDGVTGSGAASSFTGTLTLDEGKRAESDHLRPNIAFTTLDLAPLLRGSSGGEEMALGAPAKPGLLVDGDVRSRQMTWGRYRFADVALHAATSGRNVKSLTASFAFAGGKAAAQGRRD
jgi:hypothetical protein